MTKTPLISFGVHSLFLSFEYLYFEFVSARPGATPFRVIWGPDGSPTKELFVQDVGVGLGERFQYSDFEFDSVYIFNSIAREP
jgi:hypothetical protein